MKIAVFDTETTGLPQTQPLARVCEVACVVVEEGCVLSDTFVSLCNPGELHLQGEWADEAFRINGLSPEMLRKAPTTWSIGLALQGWLAAHEIQYVTSFGQAFDFHPLLLGSQEWLGTMSHLQKKACIKQVYGGLSLLTSVSTYLPDLRPSRRLIAHQALNDALMAAELVKYRWHTFVRSAAVPLMPPVRSTMSPLTREDLCRSE